MFCSSCGASLPDEARFCVHCGAPVNQVGGKTTINMPGTKLVPAKCPNCGASLEVDATQKAAVCPYCNTAYIVDQAINNVNVQMSGNMQFESATINVSGLNTENLLKRAQDFENRRDYESALEYYNKILDMDIENQIARTGVARAEAAISNFVYFQTRANSGFLNGCLQLKKDVLVYVSAKGKEKVYKLRNISGQKKSLGCLEFTYKQSQFTTTFGCDHAQRWVNLISDAQQGIYPKR